MPVKLRLRRQGRSKAPHYAIVAADSRSPRDGRFIEKIGFYNPVTHPAKVYFDYDLALKWLKNGAQPTNTVRHLLRHAGITVKFALIKQGKSEDELEKIFTRWWKDKQAKAKKKVEIVNIRGEILKQAPGYEVPEAEEDPSTEVPTQEVSTQETPVEADGDKAESPDDVAVGESTTEKADSTTTGTSQEEDAEQQASDVPMPELTEEENEEEVASESVKEKETEKS